MGGKRTNKLILNNTLLHIIKLLTKFNIPNWFIGYGTLLGIIRENSCIEGDDDIDIVCDKTSYDKIKQILIDDGLRIETGYGILNSRKIIKTKSDTKRNLCTIDIYMANIDQKGNFHDMWENVTWSTCFHNGKLIPYKWEEVILYLPNNAKTKLENRYGKNWKIPQRSKGLSPQKKVI